MIVVCAHIPRFALTVAAGGAEALAGKALALVPSTADELRIGEASGAAEAHGVAAGMALAEALARCPDLELIAADPLAVAEAWERALRALEAIGAAVEPGLEGTVYFEADGLRGLHGSDAGTIAAARRALARPARLGAAPTRFGALAAALSTRATQPRILDADDAYTLLTRTPVQLLTQREQTAPLVAPLQRLGVRTLGELRGLGAAALSDRFGDAGLLAYGLAAGTDMPLIPRVLEETLSEAMHVVDAGSGEMLARILGVLVDRVLANQRRRGRTLRVVVLAADLDGGGTWRERVVFREALGDRDRMCLALTPRLALLPAPAHRLCLQVERFGPVGGDQQALLDQGIQARRERLHEAVQQVRSVAGHDAALRAVCIDPDSRVPERRAVLSPLP